MNKKKNLLSSSFQYHSDKCLSFNNWQSYPTKNKTTTTTWQSYPREFPHILNPRGFRLLKVFILLESSSPTLLVDFENLQFYKFYTSTQNPKSLTNTNSQ